MDDMITITHAYGSTMRLRTPDFLDKFSLADLKKLLMPLFKYCCLEENKKAFETLDHLIPERITQKKAEWAAASLDFTDGYVDTKFNVFHSEREKKAAVSKNNKLHKAVGTAKRQYEKAVKVDKMYSELKKKYFM